MNIKTIRSFLAKTVFILFALPSLSWAGAVLTFHGRILDNSDRPLEAPSVSFRIRIYSPNPSKCLLYEETRTLDMQNSRGVFVIPIGDGNGTRTGSDPGLTMENVFANNGQTIPSLSCNSTTSYTPQDLDQRQMAVSFDENGGYGWDNLPPMDIAYVPFAVHAHDAQNIGGVPAGSILRVSGGAAASALTPANFSELLNLVNGGSSQYEKAGQLRGTNVPALSNGQVLGWNGGWTAITPMTSYTETDPSVKAYAKSDLPSCGTNAFLKNDGAGNFSCVAVTGADGGTVTAVSAGAGLVNQSSPGNPITTTGTLAVDVGTGAGQIVQLDGSSRLPGVNGSLLTNVIASGLSSTASINTSGSIVTSGNIQTTQDMTARRFVLFDHSGVGPDSISLQAPSDMAGAGGASYTLTLPENKGTAGQVLAAKDGNGALEWTSPSSGSVTSVTASAPLSASAGATPNIAIQQANGSQGGYLSSSDWTAFSSKLGETLAAGKIFVGNGSNVATEQTPAGDVSMTNGGVFTVEKVQGRAVSATTPIDGQVFKYVGGGTNQWQAANFGIGDLKTSLGGQQFGSATCNSNQTLTWSSLTDAFTCANIGSLNASAITAGTLDIARIPTGTNASSVAVGNDSRFPTGTCASGNKMRWDGSAWQCEPDNTSDTTKVAKSGDTMTGALNLPSNGLIVGTDQLVVNGGNVGIGTTTPGAKLEVTGSSGATLKIVDGNQALGRILTSDANGVASWALPSVSGSSFGAQSANTVFAGPSSGGSATPGFRSLASDDIPSLTMSKISNAGTAALLNVPAAGNAGAGEVVKGDDSRLTDTRTPTDGSVTTAKIVDGNVTDAKITSMAANKLTGTVARGALPVADGSSVGNESGILSGIAQSIKGIKTFLDNVIVNGNLSVTGTLSAGATSVTSLASTGSVSADTITVVNGLKVGTGATVCSGAANEGTLRYNSTSKEIELCTGLAWVSVGSATGGGGGCPTNYVPVPALSPYTTQNFCVSKYTISNVGGDATSRPGKLPWVSINRDQAANQCRLLGAGYQLISNAQWQTVARNIETVAWNWSSGTVGTGSLNRGHSDNSPASALAPDADDNNACVGTGQTCDGTTWNLQRRTFKLSNNEILWDFAGNVWSWTNDDYADLGVNPAISAAWQELSGLSATNKDLFSSANGTWNSTQGIGQAYGSSAGAVLRGGVWYHGAYSGVFAVYLNGAPSGTSPSIGFRCVFVP